MVERGVFHGIPHVPAREIVPNMGIIFPNAGWESIPGALHFLRRLQQKSSPFYQTVATMLDYPGQESEEGFFIATRMLTRVKPDKKLFLSPQPTLDTWIATYTFAHAMHGMIELKEREDHTKTTGTGKQFCRTFERVTEQLRGTLLRLDKRHAGDFEAVLRFEDAYQLVRAHALRDAVELDERIEKGLRNKWMSKESAAKVEQAGYELGASSLEMRVMDAEKRAWDRFRTADWSWEHVAKVLTMLPGFRSEKVAINVQAALESQLFEQSKWRKRSLRSLPPDIVLNAQGIAAILPHRWTDALIQNVLPSYPNIQAQLDTTVRLSPDAFVPRRYLPACAISLLREAGQVMPPLTFTNLIDDVHEVVRKRSRSAVSWLTVLVATKGTYPSTAPFVEHLMSEWQELPEPCRKVLCNHSPGAIWLTRDGRITMKERQSAFLIHRSSVPDERTIFARG